MTPILGVLLALACPELAVDADDPSLIAVVREAYAARADIDTCAHVRLSARGTRIAVTVELPDGRTATRTVANRAEIAPALEALLRLPEPEPEVIAQAPAEAAPVEAVTVEPAPIVAPEADRVPVAPKRAAVSAELAAGAGLRTGLRAGYSVGALFLFDIDTKLVGVQARYDQYRSPVGQAGGTVDVVGGKRFRFGVASLDLVGGAGVHREQVSDVPMPVLQGPMTIPLRPSASESDVLSPELMVGVRLDLRASSIFRGFVAIDGAIGSAWSAGLTFGAVVGT